MSVYQVPVFRLDFQTYPVVNVASQVMSVTDDDGVFDDETPIDIETFDYSQQNLTYDFDGARAGNAVESVYKWNVLNQTTGESGYAYLIRMYDRPHGYEPFRAAQVGDYYQAFSINVQQGDRLTYGAATYAGQVAYDQLHLVPQDRAPSIVASTLTPALGACSPYAVLGSDDLKATDPEGAAVTYKVDGLPAGVLLVHGEIAAAGTTFTQGDVDRGAVVLLAGDVATPVLTPSGPVAGTGVALGDSVRFTATDGANPVQGTLTADYAAYDTVQTAAQWGGYWGGNGNDYLLGTAGADNMSGGNGCDLLIGGGGNDTLSGGEGNNRLFGGDGNDVLTAGNGNDLLVGGIGDDQMHANGGNNILIGGDGNDQMTAGEGNDTIYGGTGHDSISASGGNNRIDGGAGNDTITAGNGDDVIIGGAGDDVIYANGGNNLFQLGGIAGALSDGNDQIWTGNGADTYAILLKDKAGQAAGFGNDTINGFRLAEGDRLIAFDARPGSWDDPSSLDALVTGGAITGSRSADGGDLTLTFANGRPEQSSLTLKWFFWDNGGFLSSSERNAAFGREIGAADLTGILRDVIQDGAGVGVSGTDFVTAAHRFVTDTFTPA